MNNDLKLSLIKTDKEIKSKKLDFEIKNHESQKEIKERELIVNKENKKLDLRLTEISEKSNNMKELELKYK
jgi:hypothetical protein